MQISNEGILVILFVGLVAGWLAGKIVRGTGFGIIGDILVGIAGALLASLLFPKLGIRIGTGLVSEIVYSTIGAVILLLIVRLLRTGGRLIALDRYQTPGDGICETQSDGVVPHSRNVPTDRVRRPDGGRRRVGRRKRRPARYQGRIGRVSMSVIPVPFPHQPKPEPAAGLAPASN